MTWNENRMLNTKGKGVALLIIGVIIVIFYLLLKLTSTNQQTSPLDSSEFTPLEAVPSNQSPDVNPFLSSEPSSNLPDNDAPSEFVLAEKDYSKNEPCPEVNEDESTRRYRETLFAESLSTQQNLALLMLTGFDHKMDLINNTRIDNIPDYFDKATQVEKFEEEYRRVSKENRHKLLTDVYAKEKHPFIGYLLTEHCLTTSKTNLCNMDMMLDIADEQEENLATWLAALEYAFRKKREDLYPVLINKAATSRYFRAFKETYMKTLYERFKKNGQSNYAAYVNSMGFQAARYMPTLGTLLNNNICEKHIHQCLQIGSLLEDTKNDHNVHIVGLHVQIKTYEYAGEKDWVDKIKDRLDASRKAFDSIDRMYPVPNIESFFDYAIRMLHIDDEIEYYEALHSEANRLYNENPDACNLNPSAELN